MKFYDLLIEKGKEEGIIKNVVGAIIVSENNEVLIMSRKEDDFMGGIDELPSGNMESGEMIYEALIREVKEETNLDITLLGDRYPREEDFIKPFALQRNVINDNHIHMDIFYIALAENPSEIKAKEDEVLNYKWFTKDEIMSSNFDTFPEKKKMALDVLEYIDNLNLSESKIK